MKPEEKKFIESWSETRKMGMKKYMLFHGGTWGLLSVVLIQIFGLTTSSFEAAFFSRDFAIKVILFVISGILFYGLVIWKTNEKRYFNLTKNQ